MILWMKIHVVSTFAGLVVEASYVIKDTFFSRHDCEELI